MAGHTSYASNSRLSNASQAVVRFWTAPVGIGQLANHRTFQVKENAATCLIEAWNLSCYTLEQITATAPKAESSAWAAHAAKVDPMVAEIRVRKIVNSFLKPGSLSIVLVEPGNIGPVFIVE